MLAAVFVPASIADAAAEEGAAAEAQMDVLLDAIRSNRKAFVAMNLPLSDAESAAFWPLYDRYHAQTEAIGNRQIALIEDYIKNFDGLSDDKALQILDGYLTTEAERVEARRSLVGEFAKVLPGRKVAAFYQLENKIDALLRYELAATIPVIAEGDGAAPPP